MNSRLLIDLAAQAPLLARADEVAFVDVDDTLKQTYRYARQVLAATRPAYKGLNALLATVSMVVGAPATAAAR